MYCKTLCKIHHMLFSYVRTQVRPYAMPREDWEVGKHELKGFNVDLMEEISEILNTTYKFQVSECHGYYNQTSGEWNGLIGDVMKQASKKDMQF